ncbi:short-chain fatty acid transporter [Bacillus xiapuensis]|uniref:short-chain fatty acid transporter n=1 Tax=Bacillus xiapuensis TaxID=2014075 RepID=UPI000C23DD7D|nr:short-chain fatty acid transporter [Bacillus xiapuensis]
MKGLVSFFNKLMQRYLPDPFIFVIILTFFVAGLALLLTDSGPSQLVEYWGGGFWDLLAFAMQMVLVLVTGHALASSPLFKKGLGQLASIPRSPGQAIILVSLISLAACWINWGFGLVIGALFAKEIAKRMEAVDYRLLIASAYSGFVIWHGGLSGSVPLTIATSGHFSEKVIGVVPTSETLFSTYNLVIVAALFAVIPVMNRLMMPGKDQTVAVDRSLLEEKDVERTAAAREKTPADRLENSRLISLATGLLGLLFLIFYVQEEGLNLNLDIVNFIFLFLGILLHGTPKRFLEAVGNAVKGGSGIIIQFPFYAGLMGIMVSSGLADVLSEAFVSISTEDTFHVLVFWSAGLVNFFVPSGGGQWAVQAPVMLEAAQTMDVSLSKTAMAVAWGDAWTNMIQPFWALPALAIAGLKAKDIMGFCLITLLVSGVVISLGLFFL